MSLSCCYVLAQGGTRKNIRKETKAAAATEPLREVKINDGDKLLTDCLIARNIPLPMLLFLLPFNVLCARVEKLPQILSGAG